LRCLDIPGARYVKPELMFRHKDEIKEADWVLFPDYWQLNLLRYSLQKRILHSLGNYHLGHDKIEMTRALWVLCPEQLPHTVILRAMLSAKEEVLDIFNFLIIAKVVRKSMKRCIH
jgi:ribosomal protein S6--L-glutamate ligase